MSNKEQLTAVQSLCGKLAMKLGMPNAITFYVDHEQEILEGLEMEKEQMWEYIKKNYCIGQKSLEFHRLEFEQWYSQTYGGNNQLCCTPEGQIKRYVNCIGCDRKPLIQGGNK
jgi:hypothetical protein